MGMSGHRTHAIVVNRALAVVLCVVPPATSVVVAEKVME
jgi:hypothetical protein